MRERIAKFSVRQKFQDGKKILEIEGVVYDKTDIQYYIKGQKELVSEKSLEKLQKL